MLTAWHHTPAYPFPRQAIADGTLTVAKGRVGGDLNLAAAARQACILVPLAVCATHGLVGEGAALGAVACLGAASRHSRERRHRSQQQRNSASYWVCA